MSREILDVCCSRGILRITGRTRIMQAEKNKQRKTRTTRKPFNPNMELEKLAVDARESGYRSYGAMQAARYVENSAFSVKKAAELKRRTGNYKTVRERLQTGEKQKGTGKRNA